MPRDRSRKLRSEIVVNGFFASASRKDLREAAGRHKVQEDKWQHRVWELYDTVPEFHYIITYFANLVSKAIITVEKDGKPTTDAKAVEALADLFGGPEGQKEMLRMYSTHLQMSGDCWTVAIPGGKNTADEWDVYSNTVVKSTSEGYRVEGEDEDVPANALVMRMWRKHPLRPKKGDSAARSVIPILTELHGLTMRIAADIDSRLTGNGILFLPSEVSFPSVGTRKDEDGNEVAARTGADGIMDLLIEVAAISMGNQDSASAKIPLVMQMQGDQIANIRHETFWSEFDEQTKPLREEAIRRLALGMDTPPEVLTGTGDMNHWSAWQMEEAAIKAHADPLLELITASLDEGYLWPYLEGSGMSAEDARAYSFGTDTAEMRLRPNRSKEALELYDRGELNPVALRRETGFDETDAMDPAQKKEWFTKKVASGSTTPELVEAALRLIGIDLPTLAPPAETETQEERPTPSLQEHPDRNPPSVEEIAKAAASEVLLFRALERAGNKLKVKFKGQYPTGVAANDLYQFVPVAKADLDDLLADAWSCAERLSFAVDTVRLDTYARTLILSRQPHDSDLMLSYLHLTQDV